MMKKSLNLLLLLFIVLTSCQQQLIRKKKQPKLVVGIVVDQMRYDYIHRFWPDFDEGGFKKLVKHGFFLKNTQYNYIPTATGPGHSSIYTGSTPTHHGIIANNWYDRALGKGIYCTQDDQVNTVGSLGSAGKMSPLNLLSTTITDELKLANKQAKVFGVSLKDRGSILPAGHLADLAIWFDESTGNWVSSTFYTNKLPQWLEEFNKTSTPNYLSKKWELLKPLSHYQDCLADDSPYEGSLSETGQITFPYDLNTLKKKDGFGLLKTTPFGNQATTDLAIEFLKNEELGKDEHPDFLCVSYSATDIIGHTYGTESIELKDTYLRLDQDLKRLIDYLEKEIGEKNFLLFLTADHGAAFNPQSNIDRGVPSGYFYEEEVMKHLDKKLSIKYKTDKLVSLVHEDQIYLNRNEIFNKGIDMMELQSFIQYQLETLAGISRVIPTFNMNSQSFTQKGYTEKVQRGYYPKRSGDLYIILEPGWIFYRNKGTDHGSIYSYDTHVPLIWYGNSIHKGNSLRNVSITDIAPTLSYFLNISLPNSCTGEPIVELFE